MMRYKLSKWLWLSDYILIPVAVIFISFQPTFAHGFVDHLEAGTDAALVNELFHGKLPYKDIFTLFGPLNIYFEAFAMFLFGKSLTVLRGYYFFTNLATLVIAYFIGLSLCKRRFFSYVLALALIIETHHPFWATRWGGPRFTFGLLAILCAIVFFKRGKNLWSFLAGLCSSIAFLVTPDTGIFSLFSIGSVILFSTVYNFLKNKSLDIKGLSFFILGIITIFGPFLFYFAIKGILLPYIDIFVVIVTKHIKVWSQEAAINIFKVVTPDKILSYSFKYILPLILQGGVVIYTINHFRKKTISWRDYSMLCLSIYGLFMYKVAFRSIAGPQFAMAFQPVIILSFVFIDALFNKIIILREKLAARKGNLDIFIISVIIFVLAAGYLLFSEKRYYGDLKGWFFYQQHKNEVMPAYSGIIPLSRIRLTSLTINRAKGIKVPAQQAQIIDGVTKYVKSVTKPDEPVFTFPEHGMYNFLADRPCVGRFNIAGFAWTTPEYRQELLADLKRTTPRYVIYARDISNLAKSIKRTKELLPEIIKYLNVNYKVETSFGKNASYGRIDILRRKE